MNRIVRKLRNNVNLVTLKSSDNCKVVPGLSYSPSDMSRLVENGVAVSSMNDNLFYDGDKSPSFDIPLELRRGTDINDAWNAARTARRRILQAHYNDKKMYD